MRIWYLKIENMKIDGEIMGKEIGCEMGVWVVVQSQKWLLDMK